MTIKTRLDKLEKVKPNDFTITVWETTTVNGIEVKDRIKAVIHYENGKFVNLVKHVFKQCKNQCKLQHYSIVTLRFQPYFPYRNVTFFALFPLS